MLSRVAERMYWFGRLNERAENTARLVSVNANLLLDLPKMVKHIWADLINITGGSEFFYKKFTRPDERNVVKFILADETNPASLVCSVKAARENARTTREIIPAEAWEKINERDAPGPYPPIPDFPWIRVYSFRQASRSEQA